MCLPLRLGCRPDRSSLSMAHSMPARERAKTGGVRVRYTCAMELREVRPDELDAFIDAAMLAFHHDATDEERAQYREVDELGRMLVWDDGGTIAATAAIYTRDMSVPGAVVPCAAVTAVTV